MKNARYIYPLVAIWSSLLYVYLQAIYLTPLQQITRLAFLALPIFAGLLFVGYLITRNLNLSAMLSFWIIMGTLTNQRFFYTILGIVLISLMGSWLILFARKLPYPKIVPEIIITSVIFATFIFLFYTTARILINIPRVDNRSTGAPAIFSIPNNPPIDIYYLILDGYGSANAIKEYLEYDNSEFITELEKRGFIVFKDAYSNYPRTVLSLSSSLNMNYVDKFTGDITKQKAWWLLTDKIKNSQVQMILESSGYKIITIGAWETAALDKNTLHPYLIETNEYEKFFIASTSVSYLEPLLSDLIAFPSFDMHRRYVTSGFHMIQLKSREPGPKFVYAHIISPHPPFVFDKDGNPTTPSYRYNTLDAAEYPGSKEEYRNGYVQQIQFVNKNTLDTIDAILRNSSMPPIIIIQGDHGSGLYTDFFSPTQTCINERFSILLAIYTPAIEQDTMAEYMTPVNIFRTIFNEYFDSNYEILPDRHYFIKGDQIYNYEDVTSRVFETCDFTK